MFIFMSQLFAFFSFLIFLYILTVYLIHSIWEKVTLYKYNRGFSFLRWVCNRDKPLRKYLLNKWFKLTYFFIYKYKILPQKLKSCQNQFTPAYRRDIRLPYISEECRMNDDSISFHLNPFEQQRFRRKCQEKPFHREIWNIEENVQNLDFRIIGHYQYDTISNVVEK